MSKRATGLTAPWRNAVAKARKDLGIKGFQTIGGASEQGQALLQRARAHYKK